MKPAALILTLLLTAAPATAADAPAATRPASDTLLTQQQIIQAYRDGQHPLILREIPRILANPKIAAAHDRFTLLLFRAESLLQMKNFNPAVAAFTAAAKEAPTETRKAVMLATAELLKRRSGLNYVPRATTPAAPATPIPLLSLEKRHAAIAALYHDENRSLTNMISRLENDGDDTHGSTTLHAAIARLEPLAVLESAAGGDGRQTAKHRAALRLAAEYVLACQIKDVQHRIETISRKRSESSAPLKADEVSRLLRGVANLDAIPKAVAEFTNLLAADPELFAPILEEAPRTRDLANALLERYPDIASSHRTSSR